MEHNGTYGHHSRIMQHDGTLWTLWTRWNTMEHTLWYHLSPEHMVIWWSLWYHLRLEQDGTVWNTMEHVVIWSSLSYHLSGIISVLQNNGNIWLWLTNTSSHHHLAEGRNIAKSSIFNVFPCFYSIWYKITSLHHHLAEGRNIVKYLWNASTSMFSTQSQTSSSHLHTNI